MNNKWSNVLRGCAYGDAWGYKNEFSGYPALIKNQPMGPDMPEELKISDDTQMTLAVARAFSHATIDDDWTLRRNVIHEFVVWMNDEDNYRAPGNTCMSACRGLQRGEPWNKATVYHSDGCGTVMRTSPTAFLSEDMWRDATAYTAAVTHGNFTGIAASLVMAAVIRYGSQGLIAPGEATLVAFHMADGTEGFGDYVRDSLPWIQGHKDVYSQFKPDREDAMKLKLERGMKEVAAALTPALNAVEKFQADPWFADPSLPQYGGAGWRAQHALACALLCVDTYPKDPVLALRRATVTSGDSDSIAAVTGAILGSLHENPWPADWFARLEPRYQRWIRQADGYVFA